jgi:hypothetical protein
VSRRRLAQSLVLGTALVMVAVTSAQATSSVRPKVVTVGVHGNEPLLAVAPDGTLYISALQFLYRSTDHGAHWSVVPLPPESGVTEYKTDSDIAVDPSGRLYYTFDYPYAGTTAVCTSTDRAESWHCAPTAFPGSTDRMWVTAPTRTEGLFVTNAGAYLPVLSRSTDSGASWTAGEQGASGIGNAFTGRPVALPSGQVFQPVNEGHVRLDVYDRSGTPGQSSGLIDTGLPAAFTGPSAGITRDGTLYVASEAANDARGRGVVVARSRDHGKTWQQLPSLPAQQSGTAIFTAVATGSNGHVGVLAYWTPESHAPDTISSSAPWYVEYLDTADAESAHPHWRRTLVEKISHHGLICRGLGCDLETSGLLPKHTNSRFAGDFMGAAMDAHGVSYLTWMGADKPPVATPVDPSTVYGVIHFARISALR